MLLVFYTPQQSIIECVLSFIEDHSVLVGVFTSLLASSLWLRKFLRQKRAEAFFGFYSKLSLRLKALQDILEENGQLNVTKPEDGNIYSLIYLKDYINKICPGYKEPDGGELSLYQTAAKELKAILLNTENNVYPPGAKRKEWYDSEHVIFSFCEFLENEACRHSTNIAFEEGMGETEGTEEKEPKHVIKCKLLIKAMENIQSSINRAKY